MEEEQAFLEEIRGTLSRMDPELYWGAGDEPWSGVYGYVERYAVEKRLRNTALALPLVRKMVFCTGGLEDTLFEDCTAQLRHCLEVSRILIDLHAPLPAHDEDILLAATLCHVLPRRSRLGTEIGRELDPEVVELLNRIRREDFLDTEKRQLFVNRVQGNRLALLLRAADQSHFVEQLHTFSGWRTRQFIFETRNIYMPLCIYAKEHYPELAAPVSILMEKMRCLVEVAEILLGRYEVRENELTQEIFTLREENARLRELIRTAK